MPQATSPSAYTHFDQQPLAGYWHHGRAGSHQADRDLYTEETIIEIPQASREDLDEAYTAAARAQRDGRARCRPSAPRSCARPHG